MLIDIGGTIREQSASQTLERITSLLPIFGITRVASQEGLANIKLPVSVCFRPNARLLSTSQGKGTTRELADVSAIMESIECFHAERTPPADIYQSVSDLKKSGKPFVDPLLLNLSEHKSLYSESEVIGWLYLHRLSDSQRILVPRAYLDLDTSQKRTEIASRALSISTNGLASGNTLDEAITHALYELIERHSWVEYSKLDALEKKTRCLDIQSLKGLQYIEKLLKLVDESEMKISITAIHGSLKIPAFRSVIQEKNPVGPPNVFAGFGSHYVAEIALSRSITEAVQSLVTVIAGSRDDRFPSEYDQYNPWITKYAIAPTFNDSGSFKWSELPQVPSFSSFKNVLKWTLDSLTREGFVDTCFFNHQKIEYGNIPVVSLVSPGLLFEHESF